MTLTPLKFPDRSLPRITYTDVVYDPNPELFLEKGPQEAEFDNIDEFLDRREEWIKETRRIVQPEPKQFEAPLLRKPEETVELKRDYGERGLQVIVKLANIELTPEKPEYEGGKWHVEGQLVRLLFHFSREFMRLFLVERAHLRVGNLLLRQPQCDAKFPRFSPAVGPRRRQGRGLYTPRRRMAGRDFWVYKPGSSCPTRRFN